MMKSLTVTNFAVVEHLDLEFGPGLNVFSGETGAGKSILVEALGLALGDRADAGKLRAGAERADITAVFDVSNNPAAAALLAEHGLD
ncbi:MAG: AAA family ATPase, partial [Gammaproteobacteria bacterium]|nr:AAA family ATPase [Gammaproteobacteria bacterium]